MSLSDDAVKRLMIATSDAGVGNEVASAINDASAVVGVSGVMGAATIIATDTSQSIDFGSLELGDKILCFPAVAGGIVFVTCVDVESSGDIVYTASDGLQTITIDGVEVGFDATSTTDAEAALLAVAAINEDEDLALIVVAEIDGVDDTQVNITYLVPGTVGNVTLAVTGTGAVESGATLTGGSTSGELPVAAVSGDMYVVLRAAVLPDDSDVVF